MAIENGGPLNGPGLPTHKSPRHVLSLGSRKFEGQPPRLEVSAALIRALFGRQGRLERGRNLKGSNPRPSDTVADLLRQCISALALESSERESPIVCDAFVRDFRVEKKELQRPPNALQEPDRLVFVSTSSSGCLEAGWTRFGIEKRPSQFLSSDDSSGIAAKTLPERLRKASNPASDSSASELSAVRRVYGCREVHFEWSKARDGDAALRNGSLKVLLSSSIREDEVLAVPYQNSHSGSCEGLKTPVGTARGWAVIKAGMEWVLGRSIVPAQKTESSNIFQPAVVPVEDTASGIASCTITGKQSGDRDGLSSVLLTNGAGRQANLQHATAAEFSDITNVCRQGTGRRMGDNAVAGALAGICVSLCLHPVDTVKTVIQAQSFGQRSVFHNLIAILSDRGVSGLYRGLASNLASSAPISAIYTFTYESVKASLLPHLPKEYHALAHCVAGGCASIATSVVYTPSECVKQRMQVGSSYRNSWLAFLGILRNGGLPVLYSGWGAVLCRNVPQSVIKFYTYEGLKHYAVNWQPVGTSLNTWQTLAFGGLAGSTAAFFTTPFDVIKTRLQTQVQGSVMYQKGVLQVFQHIAASEGIRGLYRGLIPRLVIYVSQGALFFASYEFFKQVLSVNVKNLSFNSTCTHSQGTAGQASVVESS